MNGLTLPLRNLMGQPVRSLLTTLGVSVAVAGFIALGGLTQGLQHSFDRGIEEPGADLIVSQRQAFSLISSSVPEGLGNALSAVDGVEAAAGALLNITTADNQANIVISGWPPKSFLWENLRLIKGRVPDNSEWGVVLGEGIAGALHKDIGDTIELQFQEYRVVGIASFGTVLNQNIALVPLPGLQTLLGREGTVTLFEIHLRRPLDSARINAVRSRLQAAVAGYAINNTSEFANNIRLFQIIQAFASTISLVVLAMACLAVANTLLMAVNERTYELGILASIGWTPARMLGMILTEGVIMTIIGGVLGLAFGVATMNIVSQTRIAAGLLEPYLTSDLVIRALLAAVIIGPLGALFPAVRAIRLSPAEALRRL